MEGPTRYESKTLPKINLSLPVEPILRWTLAFSDDRTRPGYVTIPARSEADRDSFVQRYLDPRFRKYRFGSIEDVEGEKTGEWLSKGLLQSFTERVTQLSVPEEVHLSLPKWFPPEQGSQEILWGLVARPDLVVEEPLRSMLDQSIYLIHDVYRAVWEARFVVKESVLLTPAQRFVSTVSRWLLGTSTEFDEQRLRQLPVTRKVRDIERYDVLCFLLTLARQNDLLGRVVLAFNGLEHATEEHVQLLNEMDLLLTAVDRWVKIGPIPLGVMIGHTGDPDDMARLRELHPKLANKVEAGLEWVRKART